VSFAVVPGLLANGQPHRCLLECHDLSPPFRGRYSAIGHLLERGGSPLIRGCQKPARLTMSKPRRWSAENAQGSVVNIGRT
jgi:hypothetical protein